MPRPKKADRPIEKNISLPETICGKVDLILWSELEEKVPHGAWARYVQGLIEADLEGRTSKRSTVATVARAHSIMEQCVTELAELAMNIRHPTLNRCLKLMADFAESRNEKAQS